jgi:hypothetical protein
MDQIALKEANATSDGNCALLSHIAVFFLYLPLQASPPD